MSAHSADPIEFRTTVFRTKKRWVPVRVVCVGAGITCAFNVAACLAHGSRMRRCTRCEHHEWVRARKSVVSILVMEPPAAPHYGEFTEALVTTATGPFHCILLSVIVISSL